MNPIYVRRRRFDVIVKFLCLGAAIFGVTWLALILFTLFYNGLAGINLQVFTQNTPPPGSTEGGLLNAIVGSIIMTGIGVGIGAPLGLLAGTYLAEYGRNDRLTPVIRFINDIRLSAPSIITGVLLATARVAGETAPLLFTALSNQFFSLDLTKTMANLPVTINNFVQSPYVYWKQLAWSGALLITLTVLALNISARILGAERTAK